MSRFIYLKGFREEELFDLKYLFLGGITQFKWQRFLFNLGKPVFCCVFFLFFLNSELFKKRKKEMLCSIRQRAFT